MQAAVDGDAAGVVLGMLRAVEERRLDDLAALYDPEIAFHWPPGLPYGGGHRGPAVGPMTEAFRAVWEPLQPRLDLRRLHPEVVATGPGGRVVARYVWRGEAPRAGRIEAETLAEYVVREGRLLRAQMFHFDLVALVDFLSRAGVGDLPSAADAAGDLTCAS